MRRFLKSSGTLRTIVVAVVVAVVAGSTGAVAQQMITSQDIQNGTIRPVDLNKKLRKKISKHSTLAAAIPGQAGSTGSAGATGATGPEGAEGAEGGTNVSAQWGEILRNEYGSPLAQTGIPAATPPLGKGALLLATACYSSPCTTATAEKAEYGSETEFAGDKIADIHELSFSAYVTDQDVSFGSPEPNIQIEVNPKVAGKTYSSLVYNPKPIAAAEANVWHTINAAAPVTNHGEEGWWFSSAQVATATNCTQAHLCSLAEVQAAAPDAEISLSLGLGKGRDSQFQGAVDALHYNGTIYNFEPFGVEEIPAS